MNIRSALRMTEQILIVTSFVLLVGTFLASWITVQKNLITVRIAVQRWKVGEGMDREKVIHAVETAFELWIDEYTGCSWFKEDEVRKAKEDALELLKEQKTKNTGKARIFQCEKCGYGIDDIYLSNENDFDIYPHFCPNCGRSVMMECLQNR